MEKPFHSISSLSSSISLRGSFSGLSFLSSVPVTLRIAPVSGSRSTSISSIAMFSGFLAFETMLRASAVLLATVSAREDFSSLRPRRAIVFSVPPVA